MKRLATVSLVLSMVATMLVGCGECYEKMQKKQDLVQVTCTPDVLTIKGSMVEADITVTFPEMFFDEETILKITPVFVYGSEEIACAPKYVQGEDVVGNYDAISRFEGGSYTQHISFPFNKGVVGTLELRVEAKCFDDCKETPDFTPWATIAVAKGVSAVQNLAQGIGTATTNEKVEIVNGKVTNGNYVMSEGNFERSSVKSAEAEIKYLINSSSVRKNQLTAEQIKLFKDFVAENSVAERTTLGNVYASGYASPDGPEKFNNRLSEQRSKTGAKAMQKQLKGIEGVNYEIASYGEDWDGFKTLVENSDIEDKDLILNVLQMYASPVERDKEIQNMSAVFKVLAEEILPQLRRTRFAIEATYAGLTDEEILEAAKKGCDCLDVEHLLHAATLTPCVAEKTAIYEKAATKYGDARAYNNLAIVLAKQGDYAGALKALDSAAKAGSKSEELNNNYALVYLAMGETNKAAVYAQGANAEVQALAAAANGEYAAASQNLEGYNAALAQVQQGNLASAKASLEGDQSAKADYLRAVIAAKEGNTAAAKSALQSAVEKDPALAKKAAKDINLASLR